jgi:hypothetical protein
MGTPMSKTAEGPLLRRYLAGAHEEVWAELNALGAGVRDKRYLADATAVARETMRRARHNVEEIVRRLDTLGYTFWNGHQGPPGPQPFRMAFGGQMIQYRSMQEAVQDALQIDLSVIPAGMGRHAEAARDRLVQLSGLVQGLQQQQAETAARKAAAAATKGAITDHLQDPVVFAPAAEDDLAVVRKLEQHGMVLPLSLRAWIEAVGDVNLSGAHPALCFWEDDDFPGIYADPLSVFFDHFMFESESWLDAAEAGDDPETMEPVIGWDVHAKARLAVHDEQLDYGYTIELPNAAADAPLDGEPHKTNFVDYLRIAFRWGGFPGWENYGQRPEKELKFLTDGLLPI